MSDTRGKDFPKLTAEEHEDTADLCDRAAESDLGKPHAADWLALAVNHRFAAAEARAARGEKGMTDNNGWAGKPGVPPNPELNRFHWLLRKGEQWPEAWRWDPDADGCGTEYSGAWAESEGDGQPEGMAKWYHYLGPCLTPAEVDARIAAERDAFRAENARLREALQSVLNACDQGRMLERGAGGMTIDAQIRRSFYYGVPAWPIEEARAALGGEGNE